MEKKKELQRRLCAIACHMYMIRSRTRMEANAAVDIFEYFRSKLTRKDAGSVSEMKTLFGSVETLLPYRDCLRLYADVMEFEPACPEWFDEHQEEWRAFCRFVDDYYEGFHRAFRERKELDRLSVVMQLPIALEGFMRRQKHLADDMGEFFDDAKLLRFLVAGYTYGVRAERERRRGNKVVLLPVVRIPQHQRREGTR